MEQKIVNKISLKKLYIKTYKNYDIKIILIYQQYMCK